jgi:hypothetical protein
MHRFIIATAAILLTTYVFAINPSAPPPPVEQRLYDVWYRIEMSELDNGNWRSAGTFENPSRDKCVRYGRGWVEGGKPGTRKYAGPFEFKR